MRTNAELQRSAQLDLAAIETVSLNQSARQWAKSIRSKSEKSKGLPLQGVIYPV